MHFELAVVSLLLAGGTQAVPQSPSSASSATPVSSSSASASASPTLNPNDYDCIIANRGCDWKKSDYGYGSGYCGSTPFKPFQTFKDGGIVMAVAKNGGFADGCLNQTTISCCQALSKDPCQRGDKYLECYGL